MQVPLRIRKRIIEAFENPQGHEWTIQGFGMLRVYLTADKSWRLHVWDSRFRVSGVTDIHDHPWDFESKILGGLIMNRRFEVRESQTPDHPSHWKTTILCGEDACVQDDAPTPVDLETRSIEVLTARHPGFEGYRQRAEEVHRTVPLDGTVSVVRRSFLREDRDHANVFVPDGEEWVDAVPRKADLREVVSILRNAADTWHDLKF